VLSVVLYIFPLFTLYRGKMRTVAASAAFAAFSGLTAAHTYAEAADAQEPFVGWTKDDLDAKWGTDVRLT